MNKILDIMAIVVVVLAGMLMVVFMLSHASNVMTGIITVLTVIYSVFRLINKVLT